MWIDISHPRVPRYVPGPAVPTARSAVAGLDRGAARSRDACAPDSRTHAAAHIRQFPYVPGGDWAARPAHLARASMTDFAYPRIDLAYAPDGLRSSRSGIFAPFIAIYHPRRGSIPIHKGASRVLAQFNFASRAGTQSSTRYRAGILRSAIAAVSANDSRDFSVSRVPIVTRGGAGGAQPRIFDDARRAAGQSERPAVEALRAQA